MQKTINHAAAAFALLGGCAMLRSVLVGLLVCLATTDRTWSQDAPFSGPQVGEKLPAFKMRLALGPREGDEFDPITTAGDKAVMLVFVHEVTRPSVALVRTIVNYADRFRELGLSSCLVFLSDDPTATSAMIHRAQHALPTAVPIGISVDGLEGPGAYGLNRKVALTILVGTSQRVTANFALIQPSLAVDAPRIGAAIQTVLGKDHQPDLSEMDAPVNGNMQRNDDSAFRRWLAPVINRAASPEQVAEAGRAVEQHAGEDEAFRQRLGSVAHRIVQAGVLKNYGTPAAQELIQKWANDYGTKDDESEDNSKQP